MRIINRIIANFKMQLNYLSPNYITLVGDRIDDNECDFDSIPKIVMAIFKFCRQK